MNALTKKDTIWLYADNSAARNHAKKLQEAGFVVGGIVDKKYGYPANENSRGYILCGLGSWIKSDDTVIVCLYNGLIHDAVAKEIFDSCGCKKILYIPMITNMPVSVQRKLRKAYMLWEDDIFNEIEIPAYKNYDFTTSGDIRIIDETGDIVVFWCPKQFLRTGTLSQYKNALASRKLVQGNLLLNYYECKLDDFSPYMALFKFLGSGDADISSYLLIQRNTEKERRLLLEDRKRLFDVFEEKYKYDITFFMDSPAKVKWNRNGYFNVFDGLHRIFYLNYKGFDHFPVKVNSQDFHMYCDSLLNRIN